MKWRVLYEKSIAACISAIEIYNKPDFKYREETFSILMINSWEILFKAKLVKDNPRNSKILYVTEPCKKKDGTKHKKNVQIKKSRSGNPMTVELLKSIELVDKKANGGLSKALKDNIEALCEIRDTSIHFIHDNKDLSKVVMELGTASLRNYIKVSKDWFDKDLSKYNFYLMPIAFFSTLEDISIVTTSNKDLETEKILNYINEISNASPSDEKSEFNVLLQMEVNIKKSKTEAELRVRYDPNAPDAFRIEYTEEDISNKYPLTYKDLVNKCKVRYSNFKQNPKFNELIASQLKGDSKFCYERRHNPKSKQSSSTFFYSEACLTLLDKSYTKI